MGKTWTVVLALLTGCATQADIDTWRGASLTDLVLTYGAPSSRTELDSGEYVVEFSHSQTVPVNSYTDATGTHLTGGGTYHCRLWFVLDETNRVKSGSSRGNIGGCNKLIKARE
ncbi:hypothetical protein BTJ40_12215 [Microbulbifer sp. A4B17]|nr:hypothetical protein BTJ40_12215 [Microbulbifer sp. A4B17]